MVRGKLTPDGNAFALTDVDPMGLRVKQALASVPHMEGIPARFGGQEAHPGWLWIGVHEATDSPGQSRA